MVCLLIRMFNVFWWRQWFLLSITDLLLFLNVFQVESILAHHLPDDTYRKQDDKVDHRQQYFLIPLRPAGWLIPAKPRRKDNRTWYGHGDHQCCSHQSRSKALSWWRIEQQQDQRHCHAGIRSSCFGNINREILFSECCQPCIINCI